MSRVRFESNLAPSRPMLMLVLMLVASGTVVPATFTDVILEYK